MAGFVFPKPLLVAATVVLVIVPGYLGDGSGAPPGSTADYCGLNEAADQANFPGYVDFVLEDVVKNTQEQYADATTGETTYSSTSPVGGGRGAATGKATCYSGVTGNSCGKCLSEAVQYVSPCAHYTTGSAYYDQRCFLHYWQL
ncbi:unnamed protein product [Linum trigynum]|uniref:Gnk2-homologous domain-containing protein n=1 Tax=Linum trigynum TaxID=586398 RepID=A0AAV2CE06_9ROSI